MENYFNEHEDGSSDANLLCSKVEIFEDDWIKDDPDEEDPVEEDPLAI